MNVYSLIVGMIGEIVSGLADTIAWTFGKRDRREGERKEGLLSQLPGLLGVCVLAVVMIAILVALLWLALWYYIGNW
jgi:hypothetical protein